MSRRPSLPERIDAALAGGSMSFYDLAVVLYPDGAAHRGATQGGPPGCYMALSAALRRGGFPESSKGPGPGHRRVYARKASP